MQTKKKILNKPDKFVRKKREMNVSFQADYQIDSGAAFLICQMGLLYIPSVLNIAEGDN